jgi:choloylglycine hydrolase
MPPSYLRRVVLAALAASALAALALPAQACTSFRVQSQDGAWIVARSMEFEMDLKSQVMLVPPGHLLTATRPDSEPGMAWTAQHGFLGINALGLDIAADGINQAGLTVGALFLPGFAEYQRFPADGKHAVSNVDLAN